MKIEDVIRGRLTEQRITQEQLAKMTGFKSQSNIGGILTATKRGMRIDNAVLLLDALGCDLVVEERATGNRWTVER